MGGQHPSELAQQADVARLEGQIAQMQSELERRGVLIRQLQGPPATRLHVGTGPPDADTGSDGALYLDTASRRFYGPRSAGNWPQIGRLQPN